MQLWRRLVLPALMLVSVIARADLTVNLVYYGPDEVISPVAAPLVVRFGEAFALEVVVTDPAAPSGVTSTLSWSKEGGPADVVFAAPTSAKTAVTFKEPGYYVLGVTVTISGVSHIYKTGVTVNRRPVDGRYRGLLSNGVVPSGLATAKLTSTGAVSASLQIGRRTFRYRATLDAQGAWSGLASDGISSVKVTLKTNDAGTSLVVSVNRGGVIYRAGLAKTGLPTTGVPNGAFAGQHTFLLNTGGTPSVYGPQGHGFGVMKVRKTGAVSLVGKTPDGLPFTAGGVIRPSGIVDVYAPLYGFTDFLGGSLRFENNSQQKSDVSGSIVWSASQSFTGSLLLDLTGSALEPHPVYLEPWTGSSTPVTAQFSSGGQNRATVSQSFTINLGGQTVAATPNTLELSVRIFDSGLFFGTFRMPGRVDKTDFSGVVLQRTAKGGGLLRGSSTRGWVELKQGGTTPAGGN